MPEIDRQNQRVKAPLGFAKWHHFGSLTSHMDLARLRALLSPLIVALKDAGTGDKLPSICQNLGLPVPPPAESKRERMRASFAEVPDGNLPNVAVKLLEQHPPPAEVRNQIQDLLWSDTTIEISKKSRRAIARAIANEPIYLSANAFDTLLDGLWILGTDVVSYFFGRPDHSLRAAIEKHVHKNPGDWTTEELFEKLGAFEASNRRFVLFLEGLVSSDVRPDEEALRRFVQALAKALDSCGLEFRETDQIEGYPVFKIASKHQRLAGRPKNIIFASHGVKPDLRFRDAVNNDIEIVTNADKMLVYDRPISDNGLRWCELQEWWSDSQRIPNDAAAKRSLYIRLRDGLPGSSPQQRVLFESFYRGFGSAVPNLPALLPEVWLHWDPKTVRERGPEALQRLRMDFLLLFPHGTRIVIEVDGKRHYSNSSGKADSRLYADMVAADRNLKLAGYQVYRFGCAELETDSSAALVKEFFQKLFHRFGVKP